MVSVDSKMQMAMDWLRDPSLDDTCKVVERSLPMDADWQGMWPSRLTHCVC